MRPVKEYINNPSEVAKIVLTNYFTWLPDKIYLSLLYRCFMGKFPNLAKPKTFCEKIQWLKLYNRKLEYTTMVDKYAVKKYVADRIGEQHIIPLLGVWDRPEDIDYDTLPNQFVLKTSQGGGGVSIIFCKDKDKFDKGKAALELRQMLKCDIYRSMREWPYKNASRKIIAEPFMVDETGCELRDYKVLNFNGEPKYIEVDSGRFGKHTRNIYDTEWNLLDISIGYVSDHSIVINKPKQLDKMLEFARIFSKGIPFLRTDFYVINDQIYFGELTFFQRSGFTKFWPSELDIKLGELIKLPNKDE